MRSAAAVAALFGGGSEQSRGGSTPAGATTASTGGNQTADFTKAVNITADLATNSLVISAAPQDYETLKT